MGIAGGPSNGGAEAMGGDGWGSDAKDGGASRGEEGGRTGARDEPQHAGGHLEGEEEWRGLRGL